MPRQAVSAIVHVKRIPCRIWVRILIILFACCGAYAWVGRLYDASESSTSGELVLPILSGSTEERLAAVQRLYGVPDADVAIPALMSALADPAVPVRSQAALTLGPCLGRAIRSPLARLAARRLLEVLEYESDRTVRASAALGLTSMLHDFDGFDIPHDPSRGADPLLPETVITALMSELERDPSNRPAILTAIQRLDDAPLAARAALQAILDDPTVQARFQALIVASLFAGGVDAAVPILLRDLTGVDGGWRFFSCCRIAEHLRLSSSVVRILTDRLVYAGVNSRTKAAILLGELGPEARSATPALVAAVRRATASASGSRSDGGCDDSILKLTTALSLVASAAEAVPVLGDLMRSPDSCVRVAAGTALARIGPAAHEAIPALLLALKEAGEDPSVSDSLNAITEALGEIAPGAPIPGQTTDSVIELLCEALDYKIPDNHRTTVRAIGKFGSHAARAIPQLTRMVESDDPLVRHEAASALRRIGEPAKSIPDSEQSDSNR